MNILNKAITLASAAHDGQIYGKNIPYIVHPLEVMRSVRTEYPNDVRLAVIAVLHDVIEDTYITFAGIEKEFGIRIALAVGLLSRDEDVEYDLYIRNMCLCKSTECAMARIVKRHDLMCNMDNLESSSFSDKKKASLMKRYTKAMNSMPSKETGRKEA